MAAPTSTWPVHKVPSRLYYFEIVHRALTKTSLVALWFDGAALLLSAVSANPDHYCVAADWLGRWVTLGTHVLF